MKKRQLLDLVGSTLEHKKFGMVEVVGVEDEASGKISCKVLATNDIKKLIFTRSFFEVIDEFNDVPFQKQKTSNQKKFHKDIDYSKYRNHPLVKDIDKREGIYLSVLREEKESHTRFEEK